MKIMSSFATLISLLKQGKITKEEMIDLVGKFDKKPEKKPTLEAEELVPWSPPKLTPKDSAPAGDYEAEEPRAELSFSMSSISLATNEPILTEELRRKPIQLESTTPPRVIIPPLRLPVSLYKQTAPLKSTGNEEDQKPSGNTPPNNSVSRPLDGRYDCFKEKKQPKLSRTGGSQSRSPSINKKSRKMVKTSSFERSSQLVIRKKQHSIEDKQEQYNFKPTITLKGRLTPTRTCADRSYCDSVKRQMKRRKLQDNLKEREKQESSPIITRQNAYASTPGNLRILEDPADYMRRLKEEQRRKQAMIQIHKANQVAKELEECTHSPKLASTSFYSRPLTNNRRVLSTQYN